MATTNMNIRMDAGVKARAQDTFARYGLDMTTAINIFLRKSIEEQGLPFDVRPSQSESPTAHWSEAQWAAVRKMLAESEKEFEEGNFRDAFEVLAEARAKYGLSD
ncbi:MAG: type II toxin-antitoxin system RelB/DinJ family antitoxin [Clostridiales bacterium]|nr:type II toxin-antitoxin system RelB/DinJ family antitoxin [Clostridiales bacterium]